ncbi:MAG: glutamate racemase [Oscillospiraceae bacterium]|nr:glutamate racemase [Oscillospiraceae bacterium]
MDQHSPIAVFDSGVGGVSVLRELMALMPNEHYHYFGDSANAPYGLKTTNQVWNLTVSAARYLFEQRNAKALVVACNTATAAAIHDLRAIWPEKIIIGIEPALKLACDRNPGGTIGIMATEVTLREKKLAALMNRYSRDCTVLRLHSPGIVELVESGKADSPEALALMEEELGHLRGKLDALVLGCTHYPFMKKAMIAVLGEQVDILDGGPGTARETMRRLAKAGLLNDGPGSLTVENSSGDPEKIRLTYELLNVK